MTATTIEVRLPLPHRGQRRLRKQAQRFNAVCCGRRWGKTKFGTVLGMETMLAGKPVGWFAPGYKFLAEAYRDFKRIIPPELIATKNDADYRIELTTGGVLECWTTLDGDPGRSRKYARAIYDEAAKDPKGMEVWQKAIRATLADLRGDAWFFTTPRGMDWFHDLYQRGVPGPKQKRGWASFTMPTSSNPYIHPDEIEDARGELSDLVFRQEFLAEFVAECGEFFKRGDFQLYPPEELPAVASVVAVDFAMSETETADYTVIMPAGLDHRRHLFVRPGTRRMREAQPSKIAEAIVDVAIGCTAQEVLVENGHMWKGIKAALEMEMERRRRWFTIIEVNPAARPKKDDPSREPKQARARSAQAMAQWGRVWLPDDAFTQDHLLPELLSFPTGKHDDQVDCLAMIANHYADAAQGLKPVEPVETKPPRAGSVLLPGVGAGSSIAGLKAGAGVRWRSGFRK
ncbi:MAG: hypothetical protein RLZZ127_53 [Planctomycetota bacterium]|jgi:phage terminase large subunit-like protein